MIVCCVYYIPEPGMRHCDYKLLLLSDFDCLFSCPCIIACLKLISHE